MGNSAVERARGTIEDFGAVGSLSGGAVVSSAAYAWTYGVPIANVSTTRRSVTFGNGAKAVRAELAKITTATATHLRIVFGALSDADANTKLATDGQYATVPIGTAREWEFEAGAYPLRVDYATNAAAESGSTLTTIDFGV